MAALALAAAMGFRPASAETKIETKIVEFDVPGSTAAEAHAGIYRFGPRDWNRRHAYATTGARIKWAITPQETDNGCIIGSVTVTVDITITMPRLVDASKMSPKLKRAFGAYMRNLLGHERGHEKRIVAAARRIEQRIRALPPQFSCDVLWQRASAIGFDVYQELDQANNAYDTREQVRLKGDLKFPTD